MKLNLDGLKEITPLEWIIRFVFGGTVCVGTGLLGKLYGPGFAGLFLAFPAILPASLTLLMRHKGRRACVDDGSGAAAGSVGLMVFALLVWKLSPSLHAATTLALASLGWTLASLAIWKLTLADREEDRAGKAGAHQQGSKGKRSQEIR